MDLYGIDPIPRQVAVAAGSHPWKLPVRWSPSGAAWRPPRPTWPGQSLEIVYPYTQWFCWSLSLLFMAISLGVYPIFRHTHFYLILSYFHPSESSFRWKNTDVWSILKPAIFLSDFLKVEAFVWPSPCCPWRSQGPRRPRRSWRIATQPGGPWPCWNCGAAAPEIPTFSKRSRLNGWNSLVRGISYGAIHLYNLTSLDSTWFSRIHWCLEPVILHGCNMPKYRESQAINCAHMKDWIS